MPEHIVQEALAAVRQAMWTPTDPKHYVPGITLEGAVRIALDVAARHVGIGGPDA